VKGQSSIEYLVTYGWMLAAVGLVSGALYSTGFTDFCSEEATGMQVQPLDIDNFGVSDENELQIAFSNNDPQSFDYLLKEVEIENSEGESRIHNPDEGNGIIIEGGSTEAIAIPGVEDRRGCDDFDIRVSYDRGDVLLDQTQTGTLTTGMSIFN